MDKKQFSESFKTAIEFRKISPSQLSQLTGLSKSSISDWELGKTMPSGGSFLKLCIALNIDPLDFADFNKKEIQNKYLENKKISNQSIPLQKIKIPILGEIACGQPIIANEQLECYVDAINNINADFALWAKGDSMIDARIHDGDLVFIKQQETVENGEIAAVLIDDEATLKRVFYDKNKATLTLMAANSKYAPFIYHDEELNNIKILGKAVAFQSLVR